MVFFHVFLIVQIVPKCAKRLVYIYQLWANSLDTSCLLSDFIKNIGIFLLPQTFLAKMRFTSCNSIKDRLFNMHFPKNFRNIYFYFWDFIWKTVFVNLFSSYSSLWSSWCRLRTDLWVRCNRMSRKCHRSHVPVQHWITNQTFFRW